MPSLRDYRDRIASVKSTRKITSAMKMVAASKLKKAQDRAEASQPYAQAMAAMMGRLANDIVITPESPKLLIGTGKSDTYLLVIVSADRGLCGGFNANVIRRVNQQIQSLEKDGKTVKLLCVGRKGRDAMKRIHPEKVVESFINVAGKNVIRFSKADQIKEYILDQYEEGAFDVCMLVYNEFQSVLIQKPKAQQIIPFTIDFDAIEAAEAAQKATDLEAEGEGGLKEIKALYTFEPDQDTIFNELMPRNLSVQIYRAMLDSAAGEQAARMTAMDNATRNAGDLIKDLTLKYNRARQAYITKELIEIISGAEAV